MGLKALERDSERRAVTTFLGGGPSILNWTPHIHSPEEKVNRGGRRSANEPLGQLQ